MLLQIMTDICSSKKKTKKKFFFLNVKILFTARVATWSGKVRKN